MSEAKKLQQAEASPGAGTPTPTRVNDKTCPFKQGFRYDTRVGLNTSDNLQKCNRDGCQLWVSVWKSRVFWMAKGTVQERAVIDDTYWYVYEGCGLVKVIPWQLVRKEAKE